MAVEGSAKAGGAPETFGAQLNRMSGVQTEKNLFEPKNKMDKDAFLKMFTEQLRNQDPLNPVSNDQFSQQMAMFSQLEQQMGMNKNLEKLIQQGNNMQIAALQLVGKNIQSDRATIYHSNDKHSTINFKVPVDTSEVKVQINDINGQPVKLLDVGSRNAGEVTTKWDGMNTEGRTVESGKYTYKILAKGMDGKEVTVATKTDGRVNGVTTEKGTVFLLVGDQKVALNDVETIKDPSQEPAKNDTLANSAAGGVVSVPKGTQIIPVPDANKRQTPEIAVDLGGRTSDAEDGNSSGTETETSPRESRNNNASEESDRMNALMPLFFR